MNNIAERIARLRALMEERKIDACLVPTSDYHESEYVGEHFACRQYITGFTGSAGTALITRNWAGLWTDGRYFVQAAAELKDTGVELMKAGQPGVPTLEEYLEQNLAEGAVLGFDGRVINGRMGEDLKNRLADRQISVDPDAALVDELWEDRPALSAEPVWILEEKYAGKAAAEKIRELRQEMAKRGADVHIITTLDDIVWLLNIRGGDTPCNPVVLSYLAVTEKELLLFVNPAVLSEKVRAYLTGLGVTVRPYNDVYAYAAEIRNSRVLLEKGKVNFAILSRLDQSNRILDQMNLTVLPKAIKNETEIENMKIAHIKDGVTMTKFIYWMKKNIGKVP